MNSYTRSNAQEYQKRIKTERMVRGISQNELAKKLGISQSHLSYLESGQRILTEDRASQLQEIFSNLDSQK